MMSQQPLDYRAPPSSPAQPPRQEPGTRTAHACAFWVVYLVCSAVGLFILNPLLHTLLAGRPGDESIFFLCTLSILVVTLIVFVLYLVWFRRTTLGGGVRVAALLGSLAFLPPYGIFAVLAAF